MPGLKGHYNIALIPNKNIQKKLESYSQELAKNNNSSYVLGKNSIAHVSVAIFKPDNNVLEALWSSITKLQQREFNLDTNGCYFENGTSGIWHGLKIRKTETLQNLQNTITANQYVKDIKNEIGSSYFPHFTLGCCAKENFLVQNYFFDEHLMKLEKISCNLCLGLSGENGQLEEIIHE